MYNAKSRGNESIQEGKNAVNGIEEYGIWYVKYHLSYNQYSNISSSSSSCISFVADQ